MIIIWEWKKRHINITIIQVYPPIIEVEDETESFYASIQEIDHIPKQDVLIKL